MIWKAVALVSTRSYGCVRDKKGTFTSKYTRWVIAKGVRGIWAILVVGVVAITEKYVGYRTASGVNTSIDTTTDLSERIIQSGFTMSVEGSI